MGKTIQFRCPKCLKLLVKFDSGSGAFAYVEQDIRYRQDEQRKKMEVWCTKCNEHLVIEKGELVRYPGNNAGPVDKQES